jgi:hypothetical protein
MYKNEHVHAGAIRKLADVVRFLAKGQLSGDDEELESVIESAIVERDMYRDRIHKLTKANRQLKERCDHWHSTSDRWAKEIEDLQIMARDAVKSVKGSDNEDG